MNWLRIRDAAARLSIAGIGALATLGAAGCQVDVGGQTLPSPYYQADDIQYFPAGPEFKLSREAAAMEQFRARGGAASVPAAGVAPVAPAPAAVPGVVVPPGAVPPDGGLPPAGGLVPPPLP